MPRAFLIKKRERPTPEGGEGATGVTDAMEVTVEEGMEGGEVGPTSGGDVSTTDVSNSSSPACSPACRSPDDSEDEIDVESPGIDEEDHLPRASEILEKQNLEEQGQRKRVPESHSPVPCPPVGEPRGCLEKAAVPSQGSLSPRHKSRSPPIPSEVSTSPSKTAGAKYRVSPHCNVAGSDRPAQDVLRRMMDKDGRLVSPPYGLSPWGHGTSSLPPLVPSHSLPFSPTKLFLEQRAGQFEKLESSRRLGEHRHRPPSPPKLPSPKLGLAPTSSPAPTLTPTPTSTPPSVSCSDSALCVTPISAFRGSPYHEKVMTSGSSPPAVVTHIHPAYPKLHMAQDGVGSSPLAFLPNVRPGFHHTPEESGRGRQMTPPPRSRSPVPHFKAASSIKEEREKPPPSNDEESRPFSPVSRLYHRKFGQTSPSAKPAFFNASESVEKKVHPSQVPQPERTVPRFQNGLTRPSDRSSSSQEASTMSDRGARLLASGPKDLSCRPRSPSAVCRSRSPLKRNSPDRTDLASRRSESNPPVRRMSPPRPTPHRPSPHVPRSPSRPSVVIPRSRSPPTLSLGVPSSPRRALGHPASLPQSLFHPVTVRPTPMIPTSLHLSPRALPPSPPLTLKERRDSVGVPSPTGSDVSGRHHGNGSSSGRNSTSSQSPLGSPSGSPPEPPRLPDGLAVSWPQGSSAFLGSYPHHSPFLPFNLRLLHGLPAPPPPGSRTSFSEASPLPFRPFPDLTSSAFKGAPFLPPSPYFPGFRYPVNYSPPGADAGKAMLDERRVDSLDLSRLGKAPFEGMLKYPSHLEALHTGGKHHPFLPTPAELEAGVGSLLEKKKSKENEPTRFHCDSCKKSYSTFSGLSKHKQYHCASQVKKEFNCKYCDRTYISLGALKMHIRTHTLPCKCKLCGKAFSRPWLLQGHIRTHTGEKPFACPHCARAFADRSNLRAHLQTHSDVKKYSCRGCSKTFSRMSLLVKHEDGCCSPNSIH